MSVTDRRVGDVLARFRRIGRRQDREGMARFALDGPETPPGANAELGVMVKVTDADASTSGVPSRFKSHSMAVPRS